MANLKEIQEFLENIAKTDLYKVKIKTDEIEMTVQLKPEVKVAATQVQAVAQPVLPPQQIQQQQTTPENKADENNNDNSDLLTIKSPMVGTFYRKPAPDKPPFVEVGQKIKKGDVVCIIEAMKLFNEIEAEFDGEIVEILVNDATPVEFDQPLFLVKP